MNADGFAPDATSRDPLPAPTDAAAPANPRTWRRDVVDGVTRRFAIAIVPALVVALVVRLLMSDWVLVAVCGGSIAAAAVSLSHAVSPRARVTLIIGVFVSTNVVLMLYAREIPLPGGLMPMAAGFATLMGGPRWGWPTMAVTSATWLLPWGLTLTGGPQFVEMPWPSQYFRLWFLHASLTAGLVATITHVTRYLEASLERSDALLERVRVEAQAVQALTGRVREAEESERHRLARELHDDFGQRLTALRMKLQLSRLTPGDQGASIDDGIALTEELLRDVRAFARGLRPPLLDEVGLGPALRALIEAHVDRATVATAIDVPDALPRLPPTCELAAYRVMQEALANALRHAGARRLAIEAGQDRGDVVVSLTDDGRGFDPAHAAGATPGEHLGLVSMRERAAFIGATLEVRSAPGHGTTVRLRIPQAAAHATAPDSRSPTVIA